MEVYRSALVASLLALVLIACSQDKREPPVPVSGDEVRVFLARSVITMDAVRPRAVAVAVDKGRIAAVGPQKILIKIIFLTNFL